MSTTPSAAGVTVGLGGSTGPSAESSPPGVGQTISVAASSSPATTPSAGSGTVSYPGNFEYPDDVSADYPYSASTTSFSAEATWTGTPTLTLTLECPGGEQSGSGASGLSVTSANGPGACTVTLSEPETVQSAVEYTLTITPGAR